MKILTIERDCGTHEIAYQFGQADDPDSEGFELLESGSLNIDTDESGEPVDAVSTQKLHTLLADADAVFEVDNIASQRNPSRIK